MTARRRFTEKEIVGIVARQMHAVRAGTGPHPVYLAKIFCPLCGNPIADFSKIERDHDDAVGFGEGRDTPENCRYVHGHCHKQKTAKDKARMAKADRQGGKTGQRARRERREEPSIKSRGFDKRFRKRMDGTVERREKDEKIARLRAELDQHNKDYAGAVETIAELEDENSKLEAERDRLQKVVDAMVTYWAAVSDDQLGVLGQKIMNEARALASQEADDAG